MTLKGQSCNSGLQIRHWLSQLQSLLVSAKIIPLTVISPRFFFCVTSGRTWCPRRAWSTRPCCKSILFFLYSCDQEFFHQCVRNRNISVLDQKVFSEWYMFVHSTSIINIIIVLVFNTFIIYHHHHRHSHKYYTIEKC